MPTPSAPTTSATAELPSHVEDSVRSVVEFHVDHARQATPSQRAIERVTAALGRPQFLAVIVGFAALWIAAGLFSQSLHLRAFDPPPFSALQGIVSFTALIVTVLILTTQRRLDRLAEDRAQLTLQVSIIAEQKTAKLIALLEEFRADHPELPNRSDPEAEAMAASADPQIVLDAIRENQEGRFADGT